MVKRHAHLLITEYSNGVAVKSTDVTREGIEVKPDIHLLISVYFRIVGCPRFAALVTGIIFLALYK